MISYQEALNRYNNAYAPPRSKKWQPPRMVDNARALKNTATTHQSIHKTDEGIIYYQCYDAKVATFYPPESDGSYKVEVRWVDTQTTNKFFWQNGLNFYSHKCADGTTARVPYVFKGRWADPEISASLVFDVGGLLIKERSSHLDVYTNVSSAEDKAKRKAFKELFEPLITLSTFKLEDFRDNVSLDQYLGQPFRLGHNTPKAIVAFKNMTREELKPDNPVVPPLFMEACQDVFNILASSRAYKAGGFDYIPRPYKHEGYERTQEQYEIEVHEQLHTRVQAAYSITTKDFTKSLTNMLLTSAGLKVGTVRKPWGQFRDNLPTRYST